MLHLAIAALALLVGALVALQPGINSLLGKRLMSPLHAAMLSFLAGFVSLALAALASGAGLPRVRLLAGAPPWLWLGGGLLGAVYVTMSLLCAPRVGATFWVAVIVAGQVLGSLAIDHFGVLGFMAQPVNLARVVGAALVIAGMVVIARA